VNIRKETWPMLPIFDVLRQLGRLDEAECYRTFNMGIGLIMIVPEQAILSMRDILKGEPAFPLYEIGEVVSGEPSVRLV
jgi:phosphoribosylformylglycinamidine cyclo-ligase